MRQGEEDEGKSSLGAIEVDHRGDASSRGGMKRTKVDYVAESLVLEEETVEMKSAERTQNKTSTERETKKEGAARHLSA